MPGLLKIDIGRYFLELFLFALFTQLEPICAFAKSSDHTQGVGLRAQAFRVFCSGEATTRELWKAGFFYAQVEGHWYEHPDPKRSLSLAEAQKELGISLDYNSKQSSFTKCDQRRFFRLTYPSKLRVQESKGVLSINDSKECLGGIKATYVANSEILIKELPVSKSKVDASKLQDGYLSLSCFQSAFDSIGLEFYLKPVGKAKFDFSGGFDFDATKHTSITQWVNAIRQKASLNSLNSNDRLRSSASRLAKDHSVSHSAKGLDLEYLELKKNNLILIGENRAIGKSLEEIALLFWVSPNHRKLLFDPSIMFMDESISDREGGSILVSLLAGKPS